MLPLRLRLLLAASTARVQAEGTALAIVLWAAIEGRTSRAGVLIAVSTFPQLVTGPLMGRSLDRAGHPERIVSGAAIGAAVGCFMLAWSDLRPVPAVIGALALAWSTPVLTGGLSSVLLGWDADTATVAAWDSTGYNVAGLTAPVIVTLVAARHPPAAFVVLGLFALVAILPLVTGVGGSGDGGSGDGGSSDAGSGDGVCGDGVAGVGGSGDGGSGDGWSGDRGSAGPAADHTDTRVRDVARAIVTSSDLLAVTVSTTLLSLGLGGFEIALVAAMRQRGLPIERVGVLATAIAVGALVGSLVMTRVRHSFDPVAMTLAAVATSGALVLGIAAGPWGAMLAVAVAVGLVDAPLLVGTYRTRSMYAPRRLRSGVFTFAASCKLGAASIGALVATAVVGSGGTNVGLAAIGTTGVAAAGIGSWILSRGPSYGDVRTS